jgi:hypothetical protein
MFFMQEVELKRNEIDYSYISDYLYFNTGPTTLGPPGVDQNGFCC